MNPRIVLAAVLLPLILISRPASAQHPPPDDGLTGHYRGFAQSALNPDLRMPMALTVDRSDGSEFFGYLTLGPLPFDFKGRADEAGHFKGRGTGAAGEVTFDGTAQGFGEGGVLARATYKFTPATGGSPDQGVADFIRAPDYHPDPIVPVSGTYYGTYASHLGRGGGTVRLELVQEDTSLRGQIFLDEGTVKALSWEFVGGIVSCTRKVVLIGAGPAGRLLAGGTWVAPPDDGTPAVLKATFSLEFLGGGVDLGTFETSRASEPR